MKIDTTAMSVRLAGLIAKLGVTTYEELASLTPFKLADYRNVGTKTIRECQDILRERGLSLRDWCSYHDTAVQPAWSDGHPIRGLLSHGQYGLVRYRNPHQAGGESWFVGQYIGRDANHVNFRTSDYQRDSVRLEDLISITRLKEHGAVREFKLGARGSEPEGE